MDDEKRTKMKGFYESLMKNNRGPVPAGGAAEITKKVDTKKAGSNES